MVDVVDADDRVVGHASRAEMRRRNLRHRAVYVLVRSSHGELFVHRRTDTKDVYPGCWDVTIGGVLAAGEDYPTGARRELREELGIVPVELRRLGPLRFEDAVTRVVGVVFLVVHDGPMRLQREEIAEGGFVSLAEAERLAAAAPCCPDGVQALRLHRAGLE